MKMLSINELHILTDVDRRTITKRLEKLKPKPGPKQALLYESPTALRLIATGGDESLSPQDALAVARREEIALNMEVVRKERIPLDDAEEAQDRALQNCGGILKAHENKTLTAELIQEIFSEFRNMGEALKK